MKQGQFEYLLRDSGQMDIKEFMLQHHLSKQEVKEKLIIMQTFRAMQMKAKASHIVSNPCNPSITKMLTALCEDALAVGSLADKVSQLNNSPSIPVQQKSNIIPFK